MIASLERAYRYSALAYIQAHVLYLRAVRRYRLGKVTEREMMRVSGAHGTAVRELARAERAWIEALNAMPQVPPPCELPLPSPSPSLPGAAPG